MARQGVNHPARGVNWRAAAPLGVTVAAGLCSLAVRGTLIGDLIGGLCYTAAFAFALWFVIGRTAAALGAFAWSAAVEFFQLTDIPAQLSEQSVIARFVLGSTFTPRDFAAYAGGAGIAWFVMGWQETRARGSVSHSPDR